MSSFQILRDICSQSFWELQYAFDGIMLLRGGIISTPNIVYLDVPGLLIHNNPFLLKLFSKFLSDLIIGESSKFHINSFQIN